MKRVFIIGEGKRCRDLLDCLLPLPSISIVGMAVPTAVRSEAKKARDVGIPVWYTDPLPVLKQLDVDMVFHLAEDAAQQDLLFALSKERHFDLIPSGAADLLLATLLEPKNNLFLREHLKISLMIAQSKTLEQVFHAIVQGGMEITHMPIGSLAIFNKEERKFTILAHKGLPETFQPHDPYPLRHGGLTQYLMETGKPLILPDIQKNDLFDTQPLLKSGLRALIAVPLLSNKELLGILYFDDTQPRTFISALTDILHQFATEAVIAIQKHQAITQVRHLSTRDPLTNLYNRNQLTLQLREATLCAEQNGDLLGLLLCDLDRFKEINETRGHLYGDKVLKLAAQSVKMAFVEGTGKTASPLLFRSGSDEIAVILPHTTPEAVTDKARLIQKAIQKARAKVNFPLDISVGAALYPQHSQTSDQLIVVANHALGLAKKEETRFCIGAGERTLDPHRIGMIFEPIVDFDQDQIIGYEALGRDMDGHFTIFELFKKYEDQGRLSELKNACFLAQLKKASELNLTKIFLNVDSTILNQCDWVLKPPDVSVVLEISEAESLHDVEGYLDLTKKWKRKGFQFAIDDFGAGFISLPFLSRLNPDYIKIDRTVMRRAVESRVFRRFLKRLVSVMQNGGHPKMIAEGIENEIECQTVRNMDISYLQGYLLKDRGYVTDVTKNLHRV